MSEMKEFLQRRNDWLKEVAESCHLWADDDPENPDFYVFQSRSDIYRPDLLIIGANPGSFVKYTDSLPYKEKGYRDYSDLEYANNQYIENEFNSGWSINKPILEIFEAPKLREKLENSVIMNVIYFNTKDIAQLKSLKNGKIMMDFCIKKTAEFIELIKPKSILFIGFDAPKWLSLKYHHIDDAVLRKDEKSFLIVKKDYKNIPAYIIHHTSRTKSTFNSKDNLQKKKNYFDKHL